MPKVGMEPRRRAEVINAALTCISLHGIDGMTLDKVAEYAGCSKGVVTYYYKNKDHLTVEALKSFMAYYGQRIESELDATMTAPEMLDVTLRHILPPSRDDSGKKINVSPLDGVQNMFIPYEDQGRLFLQFFSRAALDRNLQEVISESYRADLQGIAKIFDYGNRMGQLSVEDAHSAAYGLLAMVVGLGFFRVANIPPAKDKDNRYIGEDYVSKYMSS
ncbi:MULTISPECIES: TetR/AcrR family transcriptional regulator [Paenibacillus]|uniref:TetR/AcrR family transcriptional regulator n=1 Tax=Paenibacillus TaxID=44249 RepID=UPI0022B93476|nr:TetR/AcrR family transcriptional regulator [Paenibacillus caseinilyticus]MCZ8518285.1 TetR/AcrR family transcriptional regulator [Paenibacillus caseinilyticus]